MTRKVIIGAASLIVAVLLFAGYVRLTGSKGIAVTGTSEIADIPGKPLSGQANQIDKTVIHAAQKAVYPILDPVTKQVRRVFGFESLLNPGQQSNNWQVLKPYMNMYEKRFRCRLDAEEGSIQVEYSGGTPIPKDARLMGKVVIRILPENQQQFSETVILMDDLNYSSERSEFFTDGPVQLISAQARLIGKGMQIIYNPQNERIDYFQIKNIEYLRIKQIVTSHFVGKPTASSDSPDTANQVKSNNGLISQAESKTVSRPDSEMLAQKERGPNADAAKSASAADKISLYQCSIRKDVEIKYGKELVVQGADEVNILNILFNSSSADSLANDSSTQEKAGQISSQKTAEPAENEMSWANRGRLPQTPTDDDNTDVIILCKGGIIVQPMGGVFTGTEPEAMDIRMTGSPMRVLRRDPQQKERSLPLIQCQSLLYNPSADVLKLYAGGLAKMIRVFMNADGNYMETAGTMLWDVKSRYAQVDGPGRIVFDSAKQGQGDFSDKSKLQAEVNFGRKMDVFFAKTPAAGQQLALSAVDLAGGMNAFIQQNGFKTEAQSARFEFGQSNQLAKAKLSGDVRFASDSTSHAQADEALLTFDRENTLKVADLRGNVAFASAQGQFTSDDAKIQFAKNEDGRLEPQSLTSTTEAALVSAVSDPSQPPARFEARKMDYDLSKGSAFALGPIRFGFYIHPDANEPNLLVPVVITAQRNAEFLTSPDKKNIEKAIFHGNVIGESIAEINNEKTERRFYGDTLTVDLAADARGRTNVSHVAVTDGDVKMQNIRYLDGVKVNHVELHPVRFDYESAGQIITALGPGKIELNNQTVASDADTAVQTQAFDFRQPCYALVEGFDKLVWAIQEQKMVANGQKEALNLSYLTMKDNVPDKLFRLAVSNAELLFGKDQNNKDILSQLTASGGVYLEQKDVHVLKGQTLRYSSNDEWLSIEGSPNQPCFADGASVPVIHYNLSTGKLNFTLSSNPGAVIVP